MAYLELQGLRKTFGDVVALGSMDLSLARGEFLTLLGPSGCGKTTGLRIVAGFEMPDEGCVVLEGQDITQVPPSRRDMGMVFQAYSLFPNMTAEQNVEFGLRIRRRPSAERARRVADLFDLIGLSDARKRYPHQLSGGQQQRVALARALAIEPRVLLLDEPLSALDARVRVQLREEIRRIQTDLGITTLYVTHDQEEAMAISDRVVVMSRGHIEQIGSPTEIYGAPATPFVAEFVGTINWFEAEVLDGGQGVVDYRGTRLAVDAVRGRSPGERVVVVVRPEVVELEQLRGGHSPAGALAGRVKAHSFLGAVTRLKIGVEDRADLLADLSSARAGAFPIGVQVVVRFPPDSPRVLNLPPG
jgi:putative spermidine/putrescine transport system ATP-binding protein